MWKGAEKSIAHDHEAQSVHAAITATSFREKRSVCKTRSGVPSVAQRLFEKSSREMLGNDRNNWSLI